MKKGELRKDSIVKTAERLFFERGYEETSIQDILDALSISKGGFYHYFESKGALLEEICRQRSARDIEKLRMELLGGKRTPVQKLNLLLGALNIFAREEPDFTALLLKISYVDGDVRLREQQRIFMLDRLRPMAEDIIREGLADGSFFSRNPGQLARMVLLLGYDVNDEACRILAANAENPDCAIEIMDILGAYRDAVENLTGASYTSITIFDMEQLMRAFRQTAKQLGMIKE